MDEDDVKKMTKSPQHRVASGGFGFLFFLVAKRFEDTNNYYMMAICIVLAYSMIQGAIKGE